MSKTEIRFAIARAIESRLVSCAVRGDYRA
jgi:hypothetical protein